MPLDQLIASVLRIELSLVSSETTMQTTPQWDSLKHMELIMAIEQQYNLVLEPDEIASMTGVSAIRDVLNARGVSL
jgi:acyl carrier protein